MTSDQDMRRANAEARFKKAEAKATASAEAKAEQEAGIAARDANTARLKGLRLSRDETARAAALDAKAPKKKGPANWADLNIALNGLVKAGTILAYETARSEKGGAVAVEVVTPKGADQAEVVRLARDALPEAFRNATVRTRER